MSSFTLTRRQALLVAASAIVAVFAAAHFLGSAGSGASVGSAIAEGPATSIPALTTPSGQAGDGEDGADGAFSASVGTASGGGILVVDVVGAVRAPGLYRLPQGSRIADAVTRAGGMSRKADRTLVNLAAPLADGEQVLVPARVAGAAGTAAAPAAAGEPSPAAPVDLNTATVEQLDALPGIGPVTAQKIVDYRQEHGPFTSVDGLDAIPGIGPSHLENLKGLVIV